MYQTNLNPITTLNNTKVFPAISQPKIMGCFSVGSSREFIASGENLKYLNIPNGNSETGKQLQLDLNEGFEIRVPKPDSAKAERIDHLLRFIVGHLSQLRERSPSECIDVEGRGSKVLSCDFVCFRGLLRMVMCTPYERKTNWIVLATRYRGTIYLCAKDTPEKLQEEANQTEQQKRFCYYGFKFEQYVLTDDLHHRPDTSAPVQEAEEFCALFSTTLEGKRLLYGAEMDGIISRDPIDKSNLPPDLLNRLEFVEVKVKRRETNQRQVDNFHRFKTRNWWCQSFLVNIGKIFVGLRDDRGLVDEIREMSVKELDRDSRQFWSASVCVNFGSQFLAQVTEVMRGADCRDTVYRFEHDPSKFGNIFYSVYEGRNEESFLPDWYCAVVKHQHVNTKRHHNWKSRGRYGSDFYRIGFFCLD